MTEDRLNALAVLSIKKPFIRSIPDFDNKVIETFSAAKDRRIDIMYSLAKNILNAGNYPYLTFWVLYNTIGLQAML
jgi:hypothetical protein